MNSLPFRCSRKELPEKMTPEMWSVYRLIEENTNNGKTTTVQEICNTVSYYSNNKKESNFSNCPQLYDDIYLINTVYRWEHDKYILTNRNKMKLATKDEISKRYSTICKRYFKLNLERESLEELIDNDGQFKLFSNQGNDIKIGVKPYKESYSEK